MILQAFNQEDQTTGEAPEDIVINIQALTGVNLVYGEPNALLTWNPSPNALLPNFIYEIRVLINGVISLQIITAEANTNFRSINQGTFGWSPGDEIQASVRGKIGDNGGSFSNSNLVAVPIVVPNADPADFDLELNSLRTEFLLSFNDSANYPTIQIRTRKLGDANYSTAVNDTTSTDTYIVPSSSLGLVLDSTGGIYDGNQTFIVEVRLGLGPSNPTAFSDDFIEVASYTIEPADLSIVIVDSPNLSVSNETIQSIGGFQSNHPSSFISTVNYLITWAGSTYQLEAGSPGNRPTGPALPDTGSDNLYHKAPSIVDDSVYWGRAYGDYRVVKVNLAQGNGETTLFDLADVNNYYSENYTKLYCSQGEGRFLVGGIGILVVGVKGNTGVADFIFYSFEADDFAPIKYRYNGYPTNGDIDYYHCASIAEIDNKYYVWFKKVKGGDPNQIPFGILSIDPGTGAVTYSGDSQRQLSPHSGICIYKDTLGRYRPGIWYNDGYVGSTAGALAEQHAAPDANLSGHGAGMPNAPYAIADDNAEGRAHLLDQNVNGYLSTDQLATQGVGDTMYLAAAYAKAGRNTFLTYKNNSGQLILKELVI